MKKVMFFLLSAVILSSCVDYSGFDEDEPIIVATDYFLKVNGNKVSENDVVYVTVGEINLLEMFDAKGQKVSAVYFSDNLTSAFATGTIADITYSTIGVYRVTAKLIDGSKTISVYLSVLKSTEYKLKINNGFTVNGSKVSVSTTQSLKFMMVDSDGKVVKANFDFGDGNKISADSTTFYYVNPGTYTMKAEVASKVISVIFNVTKGTSETVILISSTVSGSTINATLGFRCNAIPDFSTSKATYVAGEVPGVSWKKYDVSEKVSIGGVDYFKWNVSVPAGKFRLSWIQQKDTNVAFNYDLCNWAYDPNSIFWNASDYLYHFYLRIENSKVVLSHN